MAMHGEPLHPADAGPPPHCHPWEEVYVVLSGLAEFTVDGSSFDAPDSVL